MTYTSIKKDQEVIIKKIAAAINADCPTPSFDNYICGVDNGDVSLPIEYEVIGKLNKDIIEGDYMELTRTERNGVKCAGIFTSSLIKSIKPSFKGACEVETNNSKYLVEIL